jgi:hypothetical protein
MFRFASSILKKHTTLLLMEWNWKTLGSIPRHFLKNYVCEKLDDFCIVFFRIKLRENVHSWSRSFQQSRSRLVLTQCNLSYYLITGRNLACKLKSKCFLACRDNYFCPYKLALFIVKKFISRIKPPQFVDDFKTSLV